MTLNTSTAAVLRYLAVPSDAATLKMAHDLAEVVTVTGSARKAQKHLQDAITAKGLLDADGNPLKALTHKRIGFYVAAVEAFPTDAAAFRADYRARARADRGATAPTGDTVPQGNTDETEALTGAAAVLAAPVITLEGLTSRLADLFADVRTLSAGDVAAFLDAVDAEITYTGEALVTRHVA